MIDGIESVTTRLLVRALDSAEVRHRTIVANIANASAGGLAVRPPRFDALLETAARPAAMAASDRASVGHTRLETTPDQSAAVASLDATAVPEGLAPQVRIDLEMARMGANSIHYQALLRGLDRHLSLVSIAVGDGKR
jgi:flagellar basal-body rod protein FlgB